MGFLAFLLGLSFGYLAWREANHPSILVEWTTSSEMDTAGFNLYRTQLEQDEEVKINDVLIPASTDPLIGGEYRFEDRGVSPGTAYEYYLEEVEIDGSTSRHGPLAVEATQGVVFEIVLGIVFMMVSGACLVLLIKNRWKG